MSNFNLSEFNSILNYFEHKIREINIEKNSTSLESYAQKQMYEYELQFWYKLKFEAEKDFMKGLFNKQLEN